MKVKRWCGGQGVRGDGDLAFFFLTFDEALQSAGRAVADAWMQARQAVQAGLASQARPIYRAAAADRGQSAPVVPEPASATRVLKGRVAAKSKAARFEKPEAGGPNAKHVQTLALILRTTSRYIAARSEPATVQRAVTTWREIFAAAKCNLRWTPPSWQLPHVGAMTRLGPAGSALDAEEPVPGLRPYAGQGHADPEVGARQAPVALPGALLKLDDLLECRAKASHESPGWVAAFLQHGAWPLGSYGSGTSSAASWPRSSTRTWSSFARRASKLSSGLAFTGHCLGQPGLLSNGCARPWAPSTTIVPLSFVYQAQVRAAGGAFSGG